ncbi:MAG: hypothetical protein QM765_12850 [Myxococcales bacterium]
MSPLVRSLLPAALLLLAACPVTIDTRPADGGAAADSGARPPGADAGTPDSGPPPELVPVTSFTLRSPTEGALLPWTLGHFFKEGDVAAGRTVAADVEDFQAVVRNRWPDGSVKFAVLSGRCDLAAGAARTVKLSSSSAAASGAALTEAELQAAAPEIKVQVGSYGTVTLASAFGSPFRQLLAGPVASEWQYRLPVGTDPHLTVWLYVRLYKGGRIEVLPSLENGNWPIEDASNKPARLVVSVAGQVAYDSTTDVDLKHHTRVVAASGHSGKVWVGGDPGIVPAHDTRYLQLSGAVPAFQAKTIDEGVFAGLAQSYTPYAQANLPGNQLGGGGDSPSIGWLPKWDAIYVVSADPRAYKAVLVNSFASAAYSYHYRNKTSHEVVRFSDYPDDKFPSATGDNYGGRAFYSGQYGSDWDMSHGWLMGYLAYLLSGDTWHLEELQFAVKWVHYSHNVDYRGHATGLMVRDFQMRGQGWAWRNCGMCAAITPDDDPERAAYVGALGASMTWLRGYHTNALGVLVEPEDYGDPGGAAFWESDYAAGSLCWLRDQKLLAGSQAQDLDAMVTFVGQGLVKRFAPGTDATGWHFARQPYRLSLSGQPWKWPQDRFDANYGVTFTRFFGQAPGPDLDTPNVIYSYPWNGGERTLASWIEKTGFGADYFEYGMSALAQAVNQGVPGAAEAFARIKATSNYPTCLRALSGDPRWGLAPRSDL